MVLEVALVSVSSPHNLPIINNFLNRSKRVKTKDLISNIIVKMAMLHKKIEEVAKRPIVEQVAARDRVLELNRDLLATLSQI